MEEGIEQDIPIENPMTDTPVGDINDTVRD